ncbi:MAG: 30S ribosomal protein S2 [Nitrososphaerota archaeon]
MSEERYVIPGILSERALITTGIHIGTTRCTDYMRRFVARMRPEGNYLFDLNKVLERINVAGKFLSQFSPPLILAYSSRELCRTPIEKFSEVVGSQAVLGRFMPGTLTNIQFTGHRDAEVLLISDPLMDQQAVTEASQVGIPVVALANTDNTVENIDLVVPLNNRGRKACAAAFWLLARATLINSNLLPPDRPLKYTIEDFETKLEALA